MTLSIKDILAADDRRPVKVDVPEWGGHIWMRPISGKQRDKLTTYQSDFPDETGHEFMVLLAMCQEDGTPIEFDELDVQDLKDKNNSVIVRLAEMAATLSSVSPQAVKETEKNCEAA